MRQAVLSRPELLVKNGVRSVVRVVPLSKYGLQVTVLLSVLWTAARCRRIRVISSKFSQLQEHICDSSARCIFHNFAVLECSDR